MRILFDKPRHLYFDEETRTRIPGSSEVLRSASLLDKMPENPSYMIRGERVHEAIEAALDDKLVWETLEPRFHGYVKAALKARDEMMMELGSLELLVGSDLYQVATKIDAVAKIYGMPHVVNWKTSSTGRGYPHYKLQMAIESLCADEHFEIAGHRRLGILLRPDGDYKPVPYEGLRDFDIVRAAMMTYWEGRTMYGDRHLKEIERNTHDLA